MNQEDRGCGPHSLILGWSDKCTLCMPFLVDVCGLVVDGICRALRDAYKAAVGAAGSDGWLG